MEHLHLLIQQVIEQHNLVLELEASVVSSEELLVLLLQFLPDCLGEAGLNLELAIQLLYDLKSALGISML